MKITCVMVTEKRAPIWGIALASFFTQRHRVKQLIVVLPNDEVKSYQLFATAFVDNPGMKDVIYMALEPSVYTVPERLDAGISAAFKLDADAVAIWDDDDFSPVDRLTKTFEALRQCDDLIPGYASYTAGWFVNLRTLYGEYIETLPHYLWGGTLAFNEAAWHRAGRFSEKPMPGYDRAFQAALKEAPESKEYRLVRGRGDPVAFSHGKNVATWLKSRGSPMKRFLRGVVPNVPDLVRTEVLRCQQLMVSTRTHPPQP